MARKKGVPVIHTSRVPDTSSVSQLETLITRTLDARKAEDIVTIDLTGKADFADRMIVASGTSARHLATLADYVMQALRVAGHEDVPVEGLEACEWVLVDAGSIVVHLFRPETRERYQLEKMWSLPALRDAVRVRQPELMV